MFGKLKCVLQKRESNLLQVHKLVSVKHWLKIGLAHLFFFRSQAKELTWYIANKDVFVVLLFYQTVTLISEFWTYPKDVLTSLRLQHVDGDGMGRLRLLTSAERRETRRETILNYTDRSCSGKELIIKLKSTLEFAIYRMMGFYVPNLCVFPQKIQVFGYKSVFEACAAYHPD